MKPAFEELSDLAQRLISEELEDRQQALMQARQLAKEGSREGLSALEEAIRFIYEDQDVEFHIPGVLVSLDIEDYLKKSLNAAGEIKKLARKDKFMKTSPAHIQKLFSAVTTFGNPVSLINEIYELYGEKQAMVIQLLGTHFIVSGTLVKSVLI
jgi:hypothetical protein